MSLYPAVRFIALCQAFDRRCSLDADIGANDPFVAPTAGQPRPRQPDVTSNPAGTLLAPTFPGVYRLAVHIKQPMQTPPLSKIPVPANVTPALFAAAAAKRPR